MPLHPLVEEYIVSGSSLYLATLDAKRIGDQQYKRTVLTLQTSSCCNLGDVHPTNHKDGRKRISAPQMRSVEKVRSLNTSAISHVNIVFLLWEELLQLGLKHWVASPMLSILEFEPLFFFVVSNSHPHHQFDLAKCLLTKSTSSFACAFLTPSLPHARTMLSREPPHVLIVY